GPEGYAPTSTKSGAPSCVAWPAYRNAASGATRLVWHSWAATRRRSDCEHALKNQEHFCECDQGVSLLSQSRRTGSSHRILSACCQLPRQSVSPQYDHWASNASRAAD